MKKIKTILAALLVLCAVTACGKKGGPIILPDTADITSIEISDENTSVISIDQSFIEEFMPLLADMEITNKRSSNDAPSVDDYISIDLHCDDRTSTIFYYKKNDVDYIEQPYQGIYKPGPELKAMMSELFVSIDGTDALFTFQATVLEVGETHILVEPVAGSAELSSSDQFSIYNKDNITLQTGDLVEIEYNGGILETSPAQLEEVYSIRLMAQE